MSKYMIFIIGCLLSAFSSSTSDEVPTMAISCGKTQLTTLPKYQKSIDTLGFKSLLTSLWDEDTKIVMVLEDELSLEDFTLKDTDGHSLFKLFENTEDRRFFPSVDLPGKTVEMLSKNDFSIKDNKDDTLVNGSKKPIGLIDLNENNHNNNDDRQSTLIKHNTEVSKLFNNLCKQYTNVILLFSGKINPWILKTEESNAHHLVTRHLMAVDNITGQFKIVDNDNTALLYSASYPFLSTDDGVTNTQLQATAAPEVFKDSRDSLLKVGSKFLLNNETVSLRFRFEKLTFTWALKAVEFEHGINNTLLVPKQTIGAQLGLSYFTEGPVIFSNNKTILLFNSTFQVQPWLKNATGGAKFGDPQEQNSFFTPPILAGLFVTFLMLFIVTWGIVMIMDIKTMDRFDDPKGKTITINVVE